MATFFVSVRVPCLHCVKFTKGRQDQQTSKLHNFFCVWSMKLKMVLFESWDNDAFILHIFKSFDKMYLVF